MIALLASLLLSAASPSSLSERIAQAEPRHGAFTQVKTLSDLEVSITTSGVFYADREKGFVWQTLKPFSQTYVITGKGLFSLQGAALEPIAAEGFPAAALIRRFLDGDISPLEHYFTAAYTPGDDDAWSLALAPKTDEVKAFVSAVSITGRGAAPESVRVTYANTDTLRISLTPAAEVPASLHPVLTLLCE